MRHATRRFRRLTFFALLTALLLAPALARAQAGTPVAAAGYEVTDLGTLGGGFSVALGVNDAGQVVGWSTTAPGQEPFGLESRAFLWENGAITQLSGDGSSAQDINGASQAVGFATTADGATRAALWEGGEAVDLGTLGGDHSMAIRINEAGQVVGHATTAPGQELLDPGTHAFLWSDGTMTDLGTLGSDFSRATGLNEAGQVVGTAETADGAVHPFLWEDGTMTDLGTLPGFGGGRALSVNEAGSVVGFAVDPLAEAQATPTGGRPLERHAWLYRDGKLTDLGTLGGTNSSALSVNAHEQVVGWSEVAVAAASGPEASPVVNIGMSTPADTPPPHAFVWQDGVMTDLNDLASGGGLVLETAFAIDDAGRIVGGAVVGEEYHAFLLTPVS